VPYSCTTAKATTKNKIAAETLMESDNEEENRCTYRGRLGTPLTVCAVLARFKRVAVPRTHDSDNEREARDPTERTCCVILAYQVWLIALDVGQRNGGVSHDIQQIRTQCNVRVVAVLPCNALTGSTRLAQATSNSRDRCIVSSRKPGRKLIPYRSRVRRRR
jgi:hypothetical protein